jgi:hypothetical protein
VPLNRRDRGLGARHQYKNFIFVVGKTSSVIIHQYFPPAVLPATTTLQVASWSRGPFRLGPIFSIQGPPFGGARGFSFFGWYHNELMAINLLWGFYLAFSLRRESASNEYSYCCRIMNIELFARR